MNFTLHATDGAARRGTLELAHGAAWRTRPNVRKSSRKMIASDAGITIMSRRVARCWFSRIATKTWPTGELSTRIRLYNTAMAMTATRA